MSIPLALRITDRHNHCLNPNSCNFGIHSSFLLWSTFQGDKEHEHLVSTCKLMHMSKQWTRGASFSPPLDTWNQAATKHMMNVIVYCCNCLQQEVILITLCDEIHLWWLFKSGLAAGSRSEREESNLRLIHTLCVHVSHIQQWFYPCSQACPCTFLLLAVWKSGESMVSFSHAHDIIGKKVQRSGGIFMCCLTDYTLITWCVWKSSPDA